MKIIQLDSHDVYFNLAAEEYLFSQTEETETRLLLWQNHNAVVIGKHQNTVEEVNLAFAAQHNIHIARRISGGGAVFHDLGNLNYSIIVQSDAMRWDIKRMADPVVAALKKMGVAVEVNDRNDLLLAGRKISGSSQYIRRDHLLHHGTLLFHADLQTLSQALKPDYDHIASKSRKSVRSPVANICDHYPDLTIPAFIAALTDVLAETSDVNSYTLSDHDIEAITKLRDEKYRTWDWIHARSPAYTITKRRQLDGREVQITMTVKDGVIQSLNLDGVGSHENKWAEIEKNLCGIKLRQDDIINAIAGLDLHQSITGISAQDLVLAITP
jgi:lipoate---protein ligase